MSIISAHLSTTGLAAVTPSFVYIDTTDSTAAVTTAGYLNAHAKSISNKNMALVSVVNAGITSTILCSVSVSTAGVVTLTAI